ATLGWQAVRLPPHIPELPINCGMERSLLQRFPERMFVAFTLRAKGLLRQVGEPYATLPPNPGILSKSEVDQGRNRPKSGAALGSVSPMWHSDMPRNIIEAFCIAEFPSPCDCLL